MKHTDLIDRLLPDPSHTLVVETPKGELVLVNTDHVPKPGDTVFVDDRFIAYRAGLVASGVAYCLIKFL